MPPWKLLRGLDRMCVVCGIEPAYSENGKSYPTCGRLACVARKQAGGAGGNINKPAVAAATQSCCVCGRKPACSQGEKNYPVCSDSCAGKYGERTGGRGGDTSTAPQLCVICHKRPRFIKGSVVLRTCDLNCLKILCNGGGDRSKCNYCHDRPKSSNAYDQCGRTCRDRARDACLMCRCRPRLGKYHFCGQTCQKIATSKAPGILEVPQNHVIWKMVETRFLEKWNPPLRRFPAPPPTIKHVYKIIETPSLLAPYEDYKQKIGNEHFCYHGTGRECRLGSGQETLCSLHECAICGVLRTMLDVKFADFCGGFGPGIYTSSASNKAYEFVGDNGVMLLNKVCLGRVYNANRFNEVMSLPPRHDSVVYNNDNGQTNETIVYDNDAIRPVFLIVF